MGCCFLLDVMSTLIGNMVSMLCPKMIKTEKVPSSVKLINSVCALYAVHNQFALLYLIATGRICLSLSMTKFFF